MFEVVEFVENEPGQQATETRLAHANDVDAAISLARKAWQDFEQRETGHAYAWWVVREPGAQLARWIADNHSHKEFVVDIRSGSLVEVRAAAG